MSSVLNVSRISLFHFKGFTARVIFQPPFLPKSEQDFLTRTRNAQLRTAHIASSTCPLVIAILFCVKQRICNQPTGWTSPGSNPAEQEIYLFSKIPVRLWSPPY